MPIIKKTTPTAAKVAITHAGVRIGCQAFSRCCLKSESSGRFFFSVSPPAIDPRPH